MNKSQLRHNTFIKQAQKHFKLKKTLKSKLLRPIPPEKVKGILKFALEASQIRLTKPMKHKPSPYDRKTIHKF